MCCKCHLWSSGRICSCSTIATSRKFAHLTSRLARWLEPPEQCHLFLLLVRVLLFPPGLVPWIYRAPSLSDVILDEHPPGPWNTRETIWKQGWSQPKNDPGRFASFQPSTSSTLRQCPFLAQKRSSGLRGQECLWGQANRRSTKKSNVQSQNCVAKMQKMFEIGMRSMPSEKPGLWQHPLAKAAASKPLPKATQTEIDIAWKWTEDSL